ncbi:hypothetical protein MCGE09_00553 [Thaumarchaeota archaeon SCGC AB-539-E09]|nr:hypothetical protein MCGE09_00553 [Thaumarchaeota archaeon SCGC AB-539-E09]
MGEWEQGLAARAISRNIYQPFIELSNTLQRAHREAGWRNRNTVYKMFTKFDARTCHASSTMAS